MLFPIISDNIQFLKYLWKRLKQEFKCGMIIDGGRCTNKLSLELSSVNTPKLAKEKEQLDYI
jgi:hypothetical protein